MPTPTTAPPLLCPQVELSRKHWPNQFNPSGKSAFDDPRVTLVFDDAARYITNKREEYDVVIVDSSDPVGRDARKRMHLRTCSRLCGCANQSRLLELSADALSSAPPRPALYLQR